MIIPSTGADHSPIDNRTIQHSSMSTFGGVPYLKGGYDYQPQDIGFQHKVGICTAHSLIQNVNKALGKDFSPDFQYLLQKKYFDLNWDEGSSIFSALKIGKNYGFLPIENFSIYIGEQDRELPYSQYVAKLQSVPDSEVTRLLDFCTDNLQGYAQVDTSDSQLLAQAVYNSKSGIICRYSVGNEWYTALDGRISWAEDDINPLRPPKTISSGHAITMSKFDYTLNTDQVLANTWSSEWNKQGCGDVNWSNNKPTEAWIPYYNLTDEQRKELQSKLQTTQLSLIQVLQKYISYLQSLLKK